MALVYIILLAKSLVEIDKSMIKIDYSSTFNINTKQVLVYGIDVESKLQVDKKK